MSSVQYLREFVNERLTVAVEEIFGVLGKTIVEYEEEIDRQRRLLDVWKREIKIHNIELPQQHVCQEEEEVLADQPLCIQERSSSLDQEEPGPPQIKEEQEELCTSQEGEQLELKQETDAFMLIPPYEESDDSEDETLNIFVKSSVAPEPNRDHQLLSHTSDEAESQNQTGDKHGDSGSTRNVKSRQQNQRHKSKSRTDNLPYPAMSVIHLNTKHKKSFICDTCGKAFKGKTDLERHVRIHTGEKPYTCKTCGKDYGRNSYLIVHMRTHTGERPYSCSTCGKGFAQKSVLRDHVRMHTGERPYSCKTCGKDFRSNSGLVVHMRIHTGEKPFTCKTCGRAFRTRGHLIDHMRTHTGEKPYSCKSCGKSFCQPSQLKTHIRVHAGDSSHALETPVENISEVIVTC